MAIAGIFRKNARGGSGKSNGSPELHLGGGGKNYNRSSSHKDNRFGGKRGEKSIATDFGKDWGAEISEPAGTGEVSEHIL